MYLVNIQDKITSSIIHTRLLLRKICGELFKVVLNYKLFSDMIIMYRIITNLALYIISTQSMTLRQNFLVLVFYIIIIQKITGT